MCRWAIVCAAALLSSGLTSAEAQSEAPRTLSEGLTLHKIAIDNDRNAILLRVSLEKFDVRVLAALAPLRDVALYAQTSPERAARGYFLREYGRMYDALAVLAGGYIADFSPPTPLGLVASNGVVASPPHESWLTEGVFCSDSGRARIGKLDDGANPVSFRDCLQAGPLLLLDGKQPADVPSTRATGTWLWA
jgi:hypothetical protein